MLKIQLKDQSREAIWVAERLYSVGSDPADNLIIRDPSVSPHHAQLITLRNKLYLKDNHSQQGCFVNNERVDKRQLAPGDVVRLGQVELMVLDPAQSISLTVEELDLDQCWSLVASEGELAGAVYYIRKNPSIIGRDSRCDIAVFGEQLSARHAELCAKGNSLLVRDLNSAKGTFINNQEIAVAMARPGDTVRFDGVSFRVAGPECERGKTLGRTPIAIPIHTSRSDIPPSERKWKTRPTSPGNRIEDKKSTRNMWLTGLTTLAVTAGLLAMGYFVFTLVT